MSPIRPCLLAAAIAAATALATTPVAAADAEAAKPAAQSRGHAGEVQADVRDPRGLACFRLAPAPTRRTRCTWISPAAAW
jgi:hypothetical protein